MNIEGRSALAAHIVRKGHLNSEFIRLDGALRSAPRSPGPMQPTVRR